jgi:hypothetical protein
MRTAYLKTVLYKLQFAFSGNVEKIIPGYRDIGVDRNPFEVAGENKE